MAGFFFHHFLLHRSQIMDRGLRAMRARLARKRRLHRHATQSLRAMRIRLARKRRLIGRLRQLLRACRVAAAENENELMPVVNTFIDQWVYDCIVDLENDPLIRNASEIINTQSLDARNAINMNAA